MNSKNILKQENIKKTAVSAIFLALAHVLPFLTGQIQQIGSMLCPMHLPVLICGYLCGAPWGAAIGLIAPLLRSVTVGMPYLFPNAIAMSFELATYGFMAGLMYKILPKKKIYIFVSLIISMLVGRCIWGIVQFILLGFDTAKFNFSIFLAGAFTKAVPGIILQLILIPIIITICKKSKFLVFENKH